MIRARVAVCGLVLLLYCVATLITSSVANAQGYQESTLYTFTGPDGAEPYAGVIRRGTTLYGTTLVGGTFNHGTVFKLDRTGKETVLYSFSGGEDGALPGLIQYYKGNLYGVAEQGGMGGCVGGCGTVFKIDTSGNETVLYSFTGGADGAWPTGTPAIDAAGNLYGTTLFGGDSKCGCGVVFKLDPHGVETVLFAFKVKSGAESGLVRDSAGNLYGNTDGGGAYGVGSVFKVDAKGVWSDLYSFTGGADGKYPRGGLALDSMGNVYGTTGAGGTSPYGVVFKIDPEGVETVLYDFSGGADGAYPAGSVLLSPAGTLYGTTLQGGTAGYGVVFQVTMSGTETVLYSFSGGADGAYPLGALATDAKGDLFSTTSGGGAGGDGVVFKLEP